MPTNDYFTDFSDYFKKETYLKTTLFLGKIAITLNILNLLQESAPVYYPSPNVSRQASQLTEEEQVKIAQRMGLIQHLPTGSYDGCKKNRE